MQRLLAVATCVAGVASVRAGKDICSSSATGFTDPTQSAIACYAGTFVVKMLGELNLGPPLGPTRKTQQHVRWHLLPYLGGDFAIESLRTDSVRDSNCTSCVSGNQSDTADALAALRAAVPSAVRRQYDNSRVCYMQLADAIMDKLPKDRTGTFLVPRKTGQAQHQSLSPFAQSVSLFRELFARGCVYEGCSGADFTGCNEPSGTDAAKGVPASDISPCVPAASNSSEPGALPTCGIDGSAPWVNVCDGRLHGFADATEAAVFCYIASFVQKMLLELTVSPPLGAARKTEQHVRTHLTPYLGGNTTTALTANDSLSDPNCTVCWADPACAVHQLAWVDTPCCYDTGLPGWDEGVCPESISKFRHGRDTFFGLAPCYASFTNYIMEALPKIGKWLVPPRWPDTPYTLAVKIVKGIFLRFGTSGCGLRLRADY